MPSLNQILASHAPLLVLDAASARIQIGLLTADGSAKWKTSDEEAGVGVFRCVEALGVDLSGVGAFAFCSGPGSILGIRTVAMALRTWGVSRPRPTFAYDSLELVASALGRTDAAVVADARRDSWHLFQAGRALRRVATSELPEKLLMPDGFRHWTPLAPERYARTPYDVAEMLANGRPADAELFRPTDAPDAFVHEEPAYATWIPRMHGA